MGESMEEEARTLLRAALIYYSVKKAGGAMILMRRWPGAA